MARVRRPCPVERAFVHPHKLTQARQRACAAQKPSKQHQQIPRRAASSMAMRQAAGDGLCSRAAGGAFALFSLLKRQGALGKGDGSAAQDRLLHQYSTGPVRTGAAAASPRSLRRRAGSGRGQPGPEQGAAGRHAAAAPGGEGRAAHDWRQRLISVRRCALAGCAIGLLSFYYRSLERGRGSVTVSCGCGALVARARPQPPLSRLGRLTCGGVPSPRRTRTCRTSSARSSWWAWA